MSWWSEFLKRLRPSKPTPVPPKPVLRAIAVVIFDDEKRPVEGVQIRLGTLVGQTNHDGYEVFPSVIATMTSALLQVAKEGYVTFSGQVLIGPTNMTIRLGDAKTDPQDVYLPALKAEVPALLPIRCASGRFRTDAVWITPRFYSVFHAPALVRDGKIEEMDRLFDRAKAARCNGVRVFGQWQFIGGGLQPYSVGDPAWFDWMKVVITRAAARGLYVYISFFCDAQVLQPSKDDRIRLLEIFATWALNFPTLLVTIANEARKNGWSEADDRDLLDLVGRFKRINPITPLGCSDPSDEQDYQKYDAMQKKIAQAGVDFLLVHPVRKARYEWVDHLYNASKTPPAVGFMGVCWIEEPMGGASQDVPGRRDGSTIAHVAAACVGAMVGGYTYMHRQMEDDVCPGLIESGDAADIPGSPDYRLYNAHTDGSPVDDAPNFAKCRTISNGINGWCVAYGEHEGTFIYASGWREVSRRRWADATGVCVLTKVTR